MVMLDHLWQSSLCALCAWLLAFALRRYRARVRYAVWLAASIKFLIPFALLTAAGSAVHYRVQAPIASPPLALLTAVDAATVPFAGVPSPAGPFAKPAMPATKTVEPLVFALWFAGTLTIAARWLTRWRRVARIARDGARVPETVDERVFAITHRHGLQVAFVETTFEPGVFGLARPILLWPAGMSARLSDEQIESIVAHEVCHVRARDNAAAVLHMAVEAVFWFHPFVWWIGARLVDERERACDEDVVLSGREAQAYAEGILKVCRFQLASPLPCVAGVTGSDLRRRITDIMQRSPGDALCGAKRWLLVAIAVSSVAAPIGAAAWRGQSGTIIIAPLGREAAFEAASIKQNLNGTFGPQGVQIGSPLLPGERVRYVNVPVRALVLAAYPGYTALEGPEWIGAPGPPSDKVPRFDVNAKAAAPASREELQMMLRALLAERFKLVLHAETKDEPVYALRLARRDGVLGPGLRPEGRDCESLRAALRNTGAADPCRVPPESNMLQFGRMSARSRQLDFLCTLLRTQLDRPVVNKTGLTGSFDWDLQFTPQRFIDAPFDASAFPLVDAHGAPIFTAVKEQFGLTLVPEKDGQPFLVIDHVERPSEN
jgi:bla regulator protein blaR1